MEPWAGVGWWGRRGQLACAPNPNFKSMIYCRESMSNVAVARHDFKSIVALADESFSFGTMA